MTGTTLQQGQIAIVQLNWTSSSSTAGFEFVLLAPVAAGTTIGFTGAGFNTDGSVANSFQETPPLTWTAPSGGLSAGSVVTISATSGSTSFTASTGSLSGQMYLDSAGYRVTAFQGTLGSGATLLYAAAVNGTKATQGDAHPYNSANSAITTDPNYIYWNTSPSLFSASDFADASQLPSSLYNHEVAFNGTNVGNNAQYQGAYYNGPTQGSAATIFAAINNAANWVTQTTYSGPASNGVSGGVSGFTVSSGPTVASINRTLGFPTLTNAKTDYFTVAFSQAVQGVVAGNFSVAGSGVSGFVGTPTSSDGGITWLVPVVGVAGNGTLALNLGSTSGITAVAGGMALATTHNSDQTYTVDMTPPAISSVTLDKSSYKLNDTVTATIHFSSYDGNGNYTLGAGSTIDGQLLTGGAFDPVADTLTATFTVTAGVNQVTAATVADNIVINDAAGNGSATTAGIANTTIDTVAPTFSQATVNGGSLVLTYAEAGSGLNGADAPTASEFAVKDGANGVTVTGLSYDTSSGTVTLALASPVAYGDAVTVSYTPNGTPSQEIQDKAGNLAASLSNQAVTNTTPVPPPTIVAGGYAVTDVAGNILTGGAGAALTGDTTATGTLSITGVGVNAASLAGVGAGTTGGTGTNVTGRYGSLTIGSDGSYSYNPSNVPAISGASTGSHPIDQFVFAVSNGSATSTETFGVTIDRAPQITIGTSATDYTVGGQPIALQAGQVRYLVSDPDGNDAVASATVTLSGYQPGDNLSFPLISGGHLSVASISGSTLSYNNETFTLAQSGGVLTITANVGTIASDIDIANILAYLAYDSSASDPTAGGTDLSRGVTVSITDASGATGTAPTETINIHAIPVITPGGYAVAAVAGNIVTGATGAALTGDTTVTGTPLSITGVGTGAATSNSVAAGTTGGTGTTVTGQYGSLTIGSDGSYSYNPNNAQAIANAPTGSHPVDQFSILVSNGASTATETFDVTIDRVPVVLSESVGVIVGGASAAHNLVTMGADRDPDGDTLTITGFTNAAGTAGTIGTAFAGTYGTLTLNGDGSYTYVPDAPGDAAYAGVTRPQDQFTYTVSDGKGGITTGPLTFDVIRPPVVSLGTPGVTYIAGNPGLTLQPPAAGAIISNPDGDSLKAVTVSITAGGDVGDALSLNLAGLTFNDGTTYSLTGNNSGTLTVTTTSFSASAADFQTLLDAITFSTTSSSTAARTVSFAATDVSAVTGAAATETVNVDTGPTILTSLLSAHPAGTDVNAGLFDFSIRFSGPVFVTGTPTLTLGVATPATYVGGNGTNTLTFEYTVQPGDNAGDLLATALNLNGGTIRDALGANAVLTGFTPIDTGIQIDTTPPVVGIAAIPTVDLAAAQAGVKISGTTDAEDGRTVTISIYPGGTVSGSPVATLTTTVSNGKWTASLTSTLPDGTYTVAADVSDKAGNAATEATTTLNVAESPTFTGATYDAATGKLIVTGTNFDTTGATINPAVLLIRGDNNGTFALSNYTAIKPDSATQFTINIGTSDRATVAALLDETGTKAQDGTSNFVLDASASGFDTTAPSAAGDTKIQVSSSGAPSLNPTGTYTSPTVTQVTVDPVVIDGRAFTVSDTPDFAGVYNGGRLRVQSTGGDPASDRFGIASIGGISGSFSQGGAIDYNGAQVGTVDIVSGSTVDFVLNADASDAAVAALINAITIADPTGTSNTASRTIAFTLIDAYNNISSPITDTVNYAAANLTIGRANNALPDQSTDTDQSTAKPFANVTVADTVPDDKVTVSVSFTSADGTLSVLGSGSVSNSNGTSTWTETGITSAVQSDLEALVFTPTAHEVAPSTTVTTGFTITASGTAGTATPDTNISVQTTDLNLAPTVTGVTPTNPTFDLGGSAVTLFTGASVSNKVGAQSFDSLTLTVSGLQDGAAESLSIDGTSVSLSATSTPVTTKDSYKVGVTVVAGTASVTINTNPTGSSPASAIAVQTLIDGIAYQDSAKAPIAGTRTVTLTGLQNDGGTVAGGVDTATLAIASNVGVTITPPSMPVLSAASDTGISSSDGITRLNTALVFTGTATSGTTVTLYDGATAIGDVVAASDGSYSVTTKGTLLDGVHQITAKASDPGGITSAPSNAETVTIDTVPPTIAITTPVGVNNVVNAATAAAGFTISGTTTGAETGQTVTVKLFNASNVVEDTYQTTETGGAWHVDVTAADAQSLADGGAKITADVSDTAGNPATEATQTIKVDETPPTFTALSEVPTTGVVGVGTAVTLTLTTSKPVTVTGTPTLTLNDGGTATYDAAKSTATSLVFDDVVAASDANVSALLPTKVNLPTAATIADLDGNPANLALAGLVQAGGIVGGAGGLQIDTIAPILTGVSETPAAGTLTLGQSDVLTLTTSKAVTVSGTPTLSLNDGGTATYDAAKSTTTALAFDYTVGAGDQPVAALAATALNLAGGTIRDAAGNALAGSPATFGQSGPQVVVTPSSASLPASPFASLFGSITHDVTGPAGDIYALYQTILGRAPDAVGLEQDVAALDHGTPLTTIAEELLSSAEYTRDHGPVGQSTNADFTSRLYQDGLHRPADTAGLRGWEGALDNGASRAEIAVDVALSGESRADLAGVFQTGVFVADPTASAIARLYYGLLGRAPDAAGFAGFESRVTQGEPLKGVAADLIGSAEYAGLHGAQSNAQFVNAIFDGALGHAADARSLAHYDHELHAGTSRATVAVQITHTPTFVAALAPNIETGLRLS